MSVEITDFGFDLNQLINSNFALIVLRAVLIAIAGLVLARLAALALRRLYRESTSRSQATLVQRGVYYLVLGLFAVAALREFGFDLGVLLGAAGILTVAIGFASQTSMSNLISGLFLLGEQPFAVGDLVQVGSTVGEVLSVDLLSVKLRKFDNTYVRIPNETLIKAEVSTLTKFPIRRIDMQLRIAYQEDIDTIQQHLFDVADKNPLCLEEPQPLLIFKGFDESAINVQFSVWVRREEYLTLLNIIYKEIKAAFDRQGIEFPVAPRTLFTGSTTKPFPVSIVPEHAEEADRP